MSENETDQEQEIEEQVTDNNDEPKDSSETYQGIDQQPDESTHLHSYERIQYKLSYLISFRTVDTNWTQ